MKTRMNFCRNNVRYENTDYILGWLMIRRNNASFVFLDILLAGYTITPRFDIHLWGSLKNEICNCRFSVGFSILLTLVFFSAVDFITKVPKPYLFPNNTGMDSYLCREENYVLVYQVCGIATQTCSRFSSIPSSQIYIFKITENLNTQW